jgi:hypothetical protein
MQESISTSLGELLSVSTLVFCIVVSMTVQFIRFVVERLAKRVSFIFPDKWESFWIATWREYILPTMPIVVGAVFAWLIPTYPYPAIFSASASARVFFGIVAGLFSGYVYKIVRFHAKNHLPKEVQDQLKKIKWLFPPEDESKEEKGKDGEKSENEE